MNEIENGYRTLDLKPGASIKEIVEARDDLLVLWDPNRLRSHPRLRSRAAVKIREIHGAYQILMQHGGRGEGATEREASADLSSTPAVASEAGPSADVSVQPVSGSASLFDEVFRDRKAEKRSRLPMGPILAGAVVALSAVLILLLIGGGDSPQEPDPTSLTVPAPLPPTPPEPAGPPVESGAETSAGSGPVKDVESGASKTPAVSTPPPQREIDTPPKAPAPAPPEPAVASSPKPGKAQARTATPARRPAGPGPRARRREARCSRRTPRARAEDLRGGSGGKAAAGRGREGIPGSGLGVEGSATAGGRTGSQPAFHGMEHRRPEGLGAPGGSDRRTVWREPGPLRLGSGHGDRNGEGIEPGCP